MAQFDATGQRVWGTYLGGAADETAYAVTTDVAGSVYMSGFTNSSAGIASQFAQQNTFGGGAWDAHLGKFTSTANLNGLPITAVHGSDQAYGIAVDAQQAAFICGVTASSTGISTPASYQEITGGQDDGFIAKYLPCTNPTLAIPNGGYLCADSPFVLEMYLQWRCAAYLYLYSGRCGTNPCTGSFRHPILYV
ncbi:MAG: hypothetical protein R2795_14720 [Saprospiraceae bacterium]